MHGSLCLRSNDGAPSYVLRSLGDCGDQDSVPSVKDLRTGRWGDGAVGEVVHKRVAAVSGLVSVREGSLEVTFNQPERKSGRTGLLGREKRGVPSRNGRRSSEAGGQTGGQGVGPGPGGLASPQALWQGSCPLVWAASGRRPPASQPPGQMGLQRRLPWGGQRSAFSWGGGVLSRQTPPALAPTPDF